MWKEVNAGTRKKSPMQFATADVTVTRLRWR